MKKTRVIVSQSLLRRLRDQRALPSVAPATKKHRCYKVGVLVPEPIRSVLERAERHHSGWSLIGGRILARVPEDAHAIQTELLPQAAADAVLARLDFEETTPYARPILERIDLGRDFYVADETGRALVRVGHGGR